MICCKYCHHYVESPEPVHGYLHSCSSMPYDVQQEVESHNTAIHARLCELRRIEDDANYVMPVCTECGRKGHTADVCAWYT